VQFSALSRKTLAASKFPKLFCPSHTQEAGREARPATPGAGVLPNFRVRWKGVTRDVPDRHLAVGNPSQIRPLKTVGAGVRRLASRRKPEVSDED